MSVPATQKAALLPGLGQNIVVESVANYKPGPGELVVKIHASALNPVDWKIQAYNFFITEYPAILGTDSAGTVEAVGEGVQNFAKGDRV